MLFEVLAPVLQDDGLLAAGGGLLYCICVGALFVIIVAGMWKMFEKGGQPGWASIIPIFNIYVMTKLVGRPWWWLLLLLIPFVGFVVWIIMMIDLAKSFGHGIGFAIGLILFPFIFYLILGFGDSEYVGAAGGHI